GAVGRDRVAVGGARGRGEKQGRGNPCEKHLVLAVHLISDPRRPATSIPLGGAGPLPLLPGVAREGRPRRARAATLVSFGGARSGVGRAGGVGGGRGVALPRISGALRRLPGALPRIAGALAQLAVGARRVPGPDPHGGADLVELGLAFGVAGELRGVELRGGRPAGGLGQLLLAERRRITTLDLVAD